MIEIKYRRMSIGQVQKSPSEEVGTPRTKKIIIEDP